MYRRDPEHAQPCRPSDLGLTDLFGYASTRSAASSSYPLPKGSESEALRRPPRAQAHRPPCHVPVAFPRKRQGSIFEPVGRGHGAAPKATIGPLCAVGNSPLSESRSKERADVDAVPRRHEILVTQPWRRRHVVHPVDELVPLPVFGEQQEVVRGPHVGGWRGWTHPVLPGMG